MVGRGGVEEGRREGGGGRSRGEGERRKEGEGGKVYGKENGGVG